MWVGGGPSGFHGGGDDPIGDLLAVQCSFCFGGFDGSKTDTAQRYGSIFADVAIHRELHRGARRGIDGSGAFESKICAARALGGDLHDDFADQFAVREHSGIGISDELVQWDGTLTISTRTEAAHFSGLRQ